MSAINIYEKDVWGDQPDCVDPLIRELGIWINDVLPTDQERERVIGPHLFTPVGTKSDNWFSSRLLHVVNWLFMERLPLMMGSSLQMRDSFVVSANYWDRMKNVSSVTWENLPMARTILRDVRGTLLPSIKSGFEYPNNPVLVRTMECLLDVLAYFDGGTMKHDAVKSVMHAIRLSCEDMSRTQLAGLAEHRLMPMVLHLCSMSKQDIEPVYTKEQVVAKIEEACAV